MIKVNQTIFTVPGGNCFSACVASLLELSLDQVPYFMDHEDWFSEFLKWLDQYGYWAIPIPLTNSWKPNGYCILSGKSPRGNFDHSVVANGLTIIHDPHPSQQGIETIVDAIILIPKIPRAYYEL